MKNRLANATTFLSALAMQVAFVWQDSHAGLGDKLAATFVACLGLALSQAKLAEVEQIILAVATPIGAVLTVALTHLSQGSKLAALGSVALATITSTRGLVAKDVAAKAGAAVLLFIGLSKTAGCHNVKPDQFFNAVVDCAKTNPEGSAALAQAETCLVGAVASNEAACLSGLVTDLHFTVDEVACVVVYVAQQANGKVAVSTATDVDLAKRQAATNWLSQERISIRNSYTGK